MKQSSSQKTTSAIASGLSTEFRDIELSSWLAVVRAYQTCTQQYSVMLAQFGLTVAQFDALSAIKKLGAKAQPKAIAEQLLVTKGNITGLLKRLQANGYIKLATHASDGRSLICSLTAEAETTLIEAQLAARHFVHQQLVIFSDETLETTRAQMTAMHAQLQSMQPETIAAEAKQRVQQQTERRAASTAQGAS